MEVDGHCASASDDESRLHQPGWYKQDAACCGKLPWQRDVQEVIPLPMDNKQEKAPLSAAAWTADNTEWKVLVASLNAASLLRSLRGVSSYQPQNVGWSASCCAAQQELGCCWAQPASARLASGALTGNSPLNLPRML